MLVSALVCFDPIKSTSNDEMIPFASLFVWTIVKVKPQDLFR